MGFPQVFPDRGSHLGLDCCAIPFDRKALLEPETRARRTGRETSDCNSRARLGRALDWVVLERCVCEGEGEEGWLGVVRPNDYFTDSTPGLRRSSEHGGAYFIFLLFVFDGRRFTLWYFTYYYYFIMFKAVGTFTR